MPDQKSVRHLAALAYAEAGIPVFPCVVDGKAPATANGFTDATTDIAQINAWWDAADYNVALSPEHAGWCVVDIDVGEGKEGEATWGALTEAHAAPPTREVRTPKGGRHLYYEGSLPPTQGNLKNGLGPGVDTRGQGSYVLIPPSVVDGKPYEVLHDIDLAPVPAWVVEGSGRRSTAVAASSDDRDTPAARERARLLLTSLVERGDVAREGQGGDTRTYQLACELLNLGLSPAIAWQMLNELWNPHCLPPWDEEELATKVENASNYAQNEGGSWAFGTAAETFGPSLGKLLEESRAAVPERSRFHFEDETEQEDGEEPSWLIPNLIADKSTVLLLGASGSFKSFLALDIALAIATGSPTFNSSPASTGPTFYAAAEGRANIKKVRRRAWKLARGVDTASDFYVGPAPMLAVPEDVQLFGDEIKRRCAGRQPKLIVLDTLAKVMAGLNENDARDAGQFIRLCDSLVEAFGCSVIAVHHTGKEEGRGARGSSAFFAGFDTVLEVKAHKATKAVEVRVKKHKDAEEPERPWTFEGKVIANSLVFQGTTAEEHRALVGDGDEFEGKKVGAALKRLGAFGTDKGVTAHVLATELVEPVGGETAEDRESRVTKSARALGALARTKLKAYADKIDGATLWFLPAPDA